MPMARKYSPTQRAAEGSVLHVVDRHQQPDKKGKYPPLIGPDGVPVTLTMMGADSPVARKLDRRLRVDNQSKLIARVRSGESDGAHTIEEEESIERHQIEKCARMTKAWTGIVVSETDFAPSPCTFEAAVALFEDDEDIRQQALDFVEDRPSFFGHSSPPSDDTAITSSL